MKKREYDLGDRLFHFAASIITIVNDFPIIFSGQQIGNQIFKAGTSSGANYEEALGAESKRNFIHKMGIVLKDLRETHYWLRLIEQTGLLHNEKLTEAISEANELRRIMARSILTAKNNLSGFLAPCAPVNRAKNISPIDLCLQLDIGYWLFT